MKSSSNLLWGRYPRFSSGRKKTLKFAYFRSIVSPASKKTPQFGHTDKLRPGPTARTMMIMTVWCLRLPTNKKFGPSKTLCPEEGPLSLRCDEAFFCVCVWDNLPFLRLDSFFPSSLRSWSSRRSGQTLRDPSIWCRFEDCEAGENPRNPKISLKCCRFASFQWWNFLFMNTKRKKNFPSPAEQQNSNITIHSNLEPWREVD